jgi:rfaE bifunctional protein nucleotidyltransferase chain/domain
MTNSRGEVVTTLLRLHEATTPRLIHKTHLTRFNTEPKWLPTSRRLTHHTAVSLREKIVPYPNLAEWRARVRSAGKQLVVTNGCFDLLHVGHVTYLEAAQQHGDLLLVGVNSDAGVRELKGDERPIMNEGDRAAVLAALQCVDAVCIFAETTAMRFLSIAKPDVYAKGGDYTIDTINQEERRLVESTGGKVVVLAGVPHRSSSALIEKIMRL